MNSPTQKVLTLEGFPYSLGDAPAASVDFGTTNFDSLNSLGTLMTFTIVADPGESAGQPIDDLRPQRAAEVIARGADRHL